MGGGGRSSSSSRTVTTNVNGTSAVSGDNLGVMLSGVNGNIGSITATDHGAVNAAKNIAESALASNNEAMQTNERITNKSIEAVSATNSEAIEAVKSLAAQSSENTRTALKAVEAAKTNEQMGGMPELTKVALGVSAAFAVGVMALAWSHK